MAVHGTKNYVYYVDKILGAGSTGTVYFGRHKRKGDACAVKLFTSKPGSKSKVQVQTNELEFMSRLQHTNIVKFLAVEQDSKSAEDALVMELCSEGSLQKRLSEPEFVHGLREKEFVVFLKQFASGLSYLRLYGVAHRDIKPGNILCHRQEDGSIIYKITDFGSSREVLGEDKSNAMYGTEEYLHPAVYRCVFIEKTRYGDDYESAAERWSIGVTIFQVATGQLPFQVQGGRSNRDLMYKITSRKRPGVISAVQKEGSVEIVESTELPKTCTFSQGLKDFIVPVIAGLVENDFNKQMTFETFFPKCEELETVVIVYVFCVLSCVCLHIYLKPTDKLQNLCQAIEKSTKVPSSEQILLLRKKPLTEIVEKDSLLKSYPRTNEDDPLLLLIRRINEVSLMPEFPKWIDSPAAPTDKNLAADATWSRDACAHVIRVHEYVQSYMRIQQNINRCKGYLVVVFISRFKGLETLHKEQETNLKTLKFNIAVLKYVLDSKYSNIIQVLRISGNNDESVTFEQDKTKEKMKRELEEIFKTAAYGCQTAHERLARAENLKLSIDISIQNSDVNSMNTELTVTAGCDDKRCCVRLLYHLKLAKTTYEQFTRDRKAQLTYNEDQIHKYEKIRLDQRLQSIRSIVFSHCLPVAAELNKQFRQWLRQTYLPRLKGLDELEEKLNRLKADLLSIWELLSKAHDSYLNGVQHVLNPELNPLLSSGYGSQSQSGMKSSVKEQLPLSSSEVNISSQLQQIKQSFTENLDITRSTRNHIKRNEELGLSLINYSKKS